MNAGNNKFALQIYNELLQLFGHQALGFEQPINAANCLKLYADSIDVRVTGYTMPKINRFELTQEVSQYEYNIPTLILTGFPKSVNVDQATLYHAKALSKSIETPLLERNIRAC